MALLICPACSASMRELKRNNVALDVCPKCRGVWLDGGELEMLMNNAIAADRVQQQRQAALTAREANRRRFRDDDDESPLEIALNLLR